MEAIEPAKKREAKGTADDGGRGLKVKSERAEERDEDYSVREGGRGDSPRISRLKADLIW